MPSHYVVDPPTRAERGAAACGADVLTSVRLPGADAALTLDVVSVPFPGAPRETGAAAEVLFVVRGRGTLSVGSERWPLVEHCGAQLPPGSRYRLEPDPESDLESGEMLVVRVAVAGIHRPATDPAHGAARGSGSVAVRRIEDCATGAATGGRDFQVLCDAASGFACGTLFVGNVPPGPAAPVHYHTYDEVLYLLEGTGVLHIDGEHTPITPGSCYRLPARTLHRIENTGESTMREVGVFVPSGSPDAAYLPDGRAALAGLPDDPGAGSQ